MPVVDLNGGDQVATIRYGWGILHELSAALTKKIPAGLLASKLRGIDQDDASVLESIDPEELMPLLFGQMESQRSMVERVLLQVKKTDGTVIWNKDKGSAGEFIDFELAPELGTAIAQHMANAVKDRSEEVKGPNEIAS